MISVDFNALMDAIGMLWTWQIPVLIIVGLAIGIVVGATPGLTGSTAIALMVGPTYYLEPIQALVLLSSVYSGGIYAGGISAILMNVPGAPAAVATTLDGYAMTQQGKQSEALGLSLASSVVGLIFSYLAILLFLRPIGVLVLKFGPVEMVLLVVFALLAFGVVQGNLVPTLICGTFGLLLGTIGATAMGFPRGTMGFDELYEGFPIVPVLVGILAVSELFIVIEKEFIAGGQSKGQTEIKALIRGLIMAFKYKVTMIRSNLIGLVIGLMPAAGGAAASIISYGQARANSANMKNFGKGEPEGLVAAEVANNASEGGAMATMMAFGIPGSGSTAVLIAAFFIHGLNPGPYLVRDHMDLAYAVILSNFLQGFFLLFVGLLFIYNFSKVVFVPTKVLVPLVMTFTVLGSITIRGLYFDAGLMFAFGVLGFFLKKLDYPFIAVLLGVILGGLFDNEFVRAFLMYQDDPTEIVRRPVFIGFSIALVVLLLSPYIIGKIKKRGSRGIRSGE